MSSIERVIRRHGLFLRRRDLLALGFSDGQLRWALRTRRIFRVRQGWYSLPEAPAAAVRAVRVGGRLTSLSALESYGLRVPRRGNLHVSVPSTACRLRSPTNRRERLNSSAAVTVHWSPRSLGGSAWRVSVAEALHVVLATETRDVAVACCSAALHHKLVTPRLLDAVFAQSPDRVQHWRALVSAADESHGETFVRLWLGDAGVPCEQQPRIPGVGRLDFRLGRRLYFEVDGGQHDPEWTGDSPSTYEHDHDRDTSAAILGDRVMRVTYRQLYSDWPRVLAAIERAIADDAGLSAYRRRHPYRPRTQRKRRRSLPERAP